MQLLKYMYEEGLLDRQEVLGWILELLEKTKSQPSDDCILRLFLPLALQYLDEFVQSELLSRRLAHLSTKKLGYMLNNVAESNLATSPHSELAKTEQKEGEKDKKDGALPNPLQSTLIEYQNCPHHRDIGWFLAKAQMPRMVLKKSRNVTLPILWNFLNYSGNSFGNLIVHGLIV